MPMFACSVSTNEVKIKMIKQLFATDSLLAVLVLGQFLTLLT